MGDTLKQKMKRREAERTQDERIDRLEREVEALAEQLAELRPIGEVQTEIPDEPTTVSAKRLLAHLQQAIAQYGDHEVRLSYDADFGAAARDVWTERTGYAQDPVTFIYNY